MDNILTRFPYLWAQTAVKNCFICGKTVEFNGDVNPSELNFSRVDGNSANGYEVYHISCCG